MMMLKLHQNWVELHAIRHQEMSNLALIGYFIPRLETQSGFFRMSYEFGGKKCSIGCVQKVIGLTIRIC